MLQILPFFFFFCPSDNIMLKKIIMNQFFSIFALDKSGTLLSDQSGKV